MTTSEQHTLEWVTTKNNRYEVPVQLTEQLETEPFTIDPKLGEGHLELDGVALGFDYEPTKGQPIVVNIRALLAAAAAPPLSPPPDAEE